MKILGAVLKLPAKQHCQPSRIYLKSGPSWPNLQYCLAGSSKGAPRIFIFSIVLGADNLSLICEIHACEFLTLTILSIGTVLGLHQRMQKSPRWIFLVQICLIKQICPNLHQEN